MSLNTYLPTYIMKKVCIIPYNGGMKLLEVWKEAWYNSLHNKGGK